MKIAKYKIIAIIAFIYSFILISPLIVVTGFRSVFFVLFSIIFLVIILKEKLSYIQLFSSIFIVFFFIPEAFFYQDIRYIGKSIFIIFAIFLVFYFNNRKTLCYFIKLSTIWVVIGVVFAFLGWLFSVLHFSPIWSMVNPDGRTWYLYYTSFALAIFKDGIIRSSFIYDEPGTFAFLVALVLTIRRMLNLNTFIDFIILIMTFVTYSLAFFIFSILYTLSFIDLKKFKNTFISIIIIVIILAIAPENLFNRLNNILNDPKFVYLFMYFDEIKDNTEKILFGVGLNYQLRGGIPINPIMQYGIIGSFVHWLLLLIGLFSFFYHKKYLVVFGISLLLFQVPFLYSVGFSFLLVLVYKLFFDLIRGEYKK